MAIDEVSNEKRMNPGEHSTPTGMIVVFIVLALLAVGEFYTVSKINSMGGSVAAEAAKTRTELDAKVDDQIASLERSNAQVLEGIKAEIDTSTKRVGMTQSALRRANASVKKLSQLQAEQRQEAEQLKGEIAQKADAQQVGALTQDVSLTKEDLGTTKTKVDTLSKDLGMARSELGTLIARNHNDIETLRKLGERDYFEFTATKNKEEKVAGVGLILKKADIKRHRFNMALLADDMVIRKDNRTVDEPVSFSVGGSKRFYELVINKVDKDKVSGYISTPKGASEVASSSQAGTQQ
ncbi:MAG: hypothetical protein DMG26_02075 [Acidobacteria bacterium]|nr:MAG: hypothetical protein DMG25_13895 [Acidobacteriota bacterium]PYV06870.1 MAG: hypothetical protein DMG26_02075 [Acidobacteriota bacterium]PYV25778.1 MAG: hypothetical protein DMG27_08845 [Acidobacteriota bacterium]